MAGRRGAEGLAGKDSPDARRPRRTLGDEAKSVAMRRAP
jgi:hypothetical protein